MPWLHASQPSLAGVRRGTHDGDVKPRLGSHKTYHASPSVFDILMRTRGTSHRPACIRCRPAPPTHDPCPDHGEQPRDPQRRGERINANSTCRWHHIRLWHPSLAIFASTRERQGPPKARCFANAVGRHSGMHKRRSERKPVFYRTMTVIP